MCNEDRAIQPMSNGTVQRIGENRTHKNVPKSCGEWERCCVSWEGSSLSHSVLRTIASSSGRGGCLPQRSCPGIPSPPPTTSPPSPPPTPLPHAAPPPTLPWAPGTLSLYPHEFPSGAGIFNGPRTGPTALETFEHSRVEAPRFPVVLEGLAGEHHTRLPILVVLGEGRTEDQLLQTLPPGGAGDAVGLGHAGDNVRTHRLRRAFVLRLRVGIATRGGTGDQWE